VLYNLADSCSVVEGLLILPVKVPATLNGAGQAMLGRIHSPAYRHRGLLGVQTHPLRACYSECSRTWPIVVVVLRGFLYTLIRSLQP
jgi:hypothetical protein